IVLSTMPFSRSGSSAKWLSIRSHTPRSHQRANRLYTLFQFPYSAGNKRHWASLRSTQITASTKLRHAVSSRPTYVFGSLRRKSRIFSHCSLVNLTVVIPQPYPIDLKCQHNLACSRYRRSNLGVLDNVFSC